VLASSGWSILSGELAVKQATMFDSFLFDAVSFLQNRLAPAEVDVRWGQIFQALMVTLVVVVLDEAPDLRFEIARQVIILQQYSVLERLMPTLDLALGLGMIGRATGMIHALLVEPFSEIAGDVA
jgi:hypothetical protein